MDSNSGLTLVVGTAGTAALGRVAYKSGNLADFKKTIQELTNLVISNQGDAPIYNKIDGNRFGPVKIWHSYDLVRAFQKNDQFSNSEALALTKNLYKKAKVITALKVAGVVAVGLALTAWLANYLQKD